MAKLALIVTPPDRGTLTTDRSACRKHQRGAEHRIVLGIQLSRDGGGCPARRGTVDLKELRLGLKPTSGRGWLTEGKLNNPTPGRRGRGELLPRSTHAAAGRIGTVLGDDELV